MKKFFVSMGLVLAALTLTNCQKTQIEDTLAVSGPEFTIIAQTADTKTSNDGLDTKWVAGDAINVFHAVKDATTYTSDGSFTVDDIETGRFTGTLASTLSEESYDWYAFYPYVSQITTPKNTSSGYVTVGGISQTQDGNDSKAHLCGKACPLYGVASGVAASESPAIAMNQLASVVCVRVTNNSGSDLVVGSVAFTATEDIVGTYYIDFVSSPVVYTSSGAKYVSSTATLTVSNGAAIANGASADFYIAVKPFTAKSGSELKMAVNGYEKTATLGSDIAFTAGHIKTLTFNCDKTQRSVTFDFTDPESLGITKPAKSGSTDITSIAYGGITLTATNGSTNTRIFNSSGNCDLRVYTGGSIKFSAPDGYVIKSIILTGEATAAIAASTGEYSDGEWTGQNQTVTFTASKNLKISTAAVVYDKGQAITSINISDVTGVSARGAEDATLTYTVENPISGTTLDVACDGTVVSEVIESDGTIMYTVSKNASASSREGKITLTYGSIVKEVKVSQDAGQFKAASAEIILDAASGSKSGFNFYSDFDWVAISTADSKFSFTPGSYTWADSGKQSVTVTATSENASEEGTIEIGEIHFYCSDNNDWEVVVTVKQNSSYVAPVTGTSVTLGSDWNTLFGTSYSGTFSIKANALSLSGISEDVTINVVNGTSLNGYLKTSDFRAYKGYTITLSVPEGKNIKKVTTAKGGKNFSSGIKADSGSDSISSNCYTWTGSTQTLKLTISDTVSFATITVMYE